ncbi:MAG: hypothetical protein HEQ23_00890 [Tepidisphaera sp.]
MGASPRSGKGASPDAPAAPAAPEERELDGSGEVSEAAANPATLETGEVGAETVEPLPPPEEPAAEEEPPIPTLTVRWSKARVPPVYNKNFRPTTPPTDEIPDECKVEMIADTTDVPDGTTASIQVYQCWFDYSVPGASFPDLEVRGGRVIDPATGERPIMTFTHDNYIYQPWDKDVYYFRCNVDFEGLEADTPSDADTQEAQCLRVMWFHMCAADSIADTPAGGGLTTNAEANEIKGIMDAKQHHKAAKHAFNARNPPTNIWGSWIRNTYCYHHASHGDIVDRTTGAQLNAGAANPPRNRVGNWRSVIIIGSKAIGDAEVSDTDACPSVPKYLAYLDTCVAGWEPSFAHAWISRGTQNVIAFRMYIPDGDARAMARRFHRKWIGTHNGDPSKINETFFEIGSRYYWTMRPVLFGMNGGEIIRGGKDPNVLAGAIAEELGVDW